MPRPLTRARRRGFAALALVLLAAAGLLWRRADLRPRWLGGRPPNLLVVSLDTLRADRLGAYGYTPAMTPRLDGLAARGLRSRRPPRWCR